MVREHRLNPLSFEADIWMWKNLLKFKLQWNSLNCFVRNLLFGAESILVWEMDVMKFFNYIFSWFTFWSKAGLRCSCHLLAASRALRLFVLADDRNDCKCALEMYRFN